MLRFLALLALLLHAPWTWGQALRVHTSPAMQPVVAALAPGFLNKTGIPVRLHDDTGTQAPDLLVLPLAQLQALADAGQVQRASIVPLGRVSAPGGPPVTHGLALPPAGPLADAAQVLATGLAGPTAAAVMRMVGIEPVVAP